MSAEATRGLARVAEALLLSDGLDIMESYYFEKTSSALVEIAEAYLTADAGAWSAADQAVLPVVAPLAIPNLATLAVEALGRKSPRRAGRPRGEFDTGARAIFRCGLILAFPPKRRVLVTEDARRACCMAMAGGLAGMPDELVSRVVKDWWQTFVPRLVEILDDEEEPSSEAETLLLSLLLWTLYRQADVQKAEQSEFEALLTTALTTAAALKDPKAILRARRIWRTVGAAAIGVGRVDLAEVIVRWTGTQERPNEHDPNPSDGFYRDWLSWDSAFWPGPLLMGVEPPRWGDAHAVEANRQAFLALRPQATSRPRRQRPPTTSGAG